MARGFRFGTRSSAGSPVHSQGWAQPSAPIHGWRRPLDKVETHAAAYRLVFFEKLLSLIQGD